MEQAADSVSAIADSTRMAEASRSMRVEFTGCTGCCTDCCAHCDEDCILRWRQCWLCVTTTHPSGTSAVLCCDIAGWRCATGGNDPGQPVTFICVGILKTHQCHHQGQHALTCFWQVQEQQANSRCSCSVCGHLIPAVAGGLLATAGTFSKQQC